MDHKDFLLWEQSTRDTLDFKKVYFDIAGSINSALLLSQIIFWFLPNKAGFSKIRIHKEGYDWLRKKNQQWFDEIRLNERQVRHALEKLVQRNIIVLKKFRHNGSQVNHIRINYEIFLQLLRTKTEEMLSASGKTEQESVSSDKIVSSKLQNCQFEVTNMSVGSDKIVTSSYTEIREKESIEERGISSSFSEGKTFDEQISEAGIVNYDPSKKTLIRFLQLLDLKWSETRIGNELKKFKKAGFDARKTMLFNLYSGGATFAKIVESSGDTFVYKSKDEQHVEKAQKLTDLNSYKGINTTFIPETLRDYCSLRTFKKFVKLCRKRFLEWDPLETDFINFQKAVIALGKEIMDRAIRNVFWIQEHENDFYQTLSPGKFLNSINIIKNSANDENLCKRQFQFLAEEKRARTLDKLQKQLRYS